MNQNTNGLSAVDGAFSTTLSTEMSDWLSSNILNYEKILLHGLMHNRKLREILMRVGITHKDFSNYEGRLLMGAFGVAAMMEEACGIEIPVPANSAFLEPHIEAAAFDQECDDNEKNTAMMLIEELQTQDHSSNYGIILPCLSAWFGSQRAKKAARKIMILPLPDVRGIIESLQADLDAASGLSFDIENRKFDFNQLPNPPKSVLTLAGRTIGTPGNIVTIQAPPKAAKSAVIEAFMAAVMKDADSECDTLGVTAAYPDGRAVLHFDTEQSAYDFDRLLRRAYRRAKSSEAAAWLHSYHLTGMDPAACWNMLMLAIKSAVKNHGGVMMILIDGIADLCKDPNDAGECFELVRKLHKLAVDHECVIVTVIHENPGSAGKTRGHLGSQLERKAETSLRLHKENKTGVVETWVERGRSCFIPKSAGVRFHWCSEAKMHLTLHASDGEAAGSTTTKPDKANRYAKELEKVFFDAEVLTWTELVVKIVTVTSLAESTAKSRIPEYVDLNLITKNDDGTYQIARPESAE